MSFIDRYPSGAYRSDDLLYAAHSRCQCGAGLAYPKAGLNGRLATYWDCSDILTGAAIPSGQDGAKMHSDTHPFSFYNIKAEGYWDFPEDTTRPKEETAPWSR